MSIRDIGIPSTKLICTLGPATFSFDRVRSLAEAGTSVFRVNFSHSTPQEHARSVSTVRAAEAEVDRPLAVMADLPGPKVRLGQLKTEPLRLVAGQTFLLRSGGEPGDAQGAPISYSGLGRDVEPGDRLLLADGEVELVVRAAGDPIVTECLRGGSVRSRSGLNAPSERLRLPAITDRDRESLARALDLGVDLVAQSFVRSSDDVDEMRSLMGERVVPIVAKVETRMAVEGITGVLASADAVMVARGDLGVELPLEEIPVLQKELIRRARRAGKPAIVATQMLESMIQAPRPTRAEVNDAANAVLDGADAVMLSAETAIGAYPVEAAAAAMRIASVAEQRGRPFREAEPPCAHRDGPSAIAHAAAQVAAQHPEVVAIACFTGTGTTPRLVSFERPEVPIYAFAPGRQVRRALAIRWGVRPVAAEFPPDTDATIATMEEGLRRLGAAREGEVVVMVASSPAGRARTNLLKTHRMGGPRS
jgi:pyruvate kinase